MVMWEKMYLHIYTYIYMIKIIKFERQNFLTLVKYVRKSNGFNWLKVEFLSGCFWTKLIILQVM